MGTVNPEVQPTKKYVVGQTSTVMVNVTGATMFNRSTHSMVQRQLFNVTRAIRSMVLVSHHGQTGAVTLVDLIGVSQSMLICSVPTINRCGRSFLGQWWTGSWLECCGVTPAFNVVNTYNGQWSDVFGVSSLDGKTGCFDSH